MHFMELASESVTGETRLAKLHKCDFLKLCRVLKEKTLAL